MGSVIDEKVSRKNNLIKECTKNLEILKDKGELGQGSSGGSMCVISMCVIGMSVIGMCFKNINVTRMRRLKKNWKLVENDPKNI